MSRRKKVETQKSYPIFAQVKEYTLDPFWCDILDNFTNGNIHPGITLKDDSIVIGSEEFETFCFSDEGDQDERAETSMMIIGALRSELGIISDTERFDKKLESFSGEEQTLCWSKVKNKAKREMFVLQFTEKEQKQKALSDEERQSLYWFLMTCIDLGCIRSDSILMEDGRIKEIQGLLFDPESASYRLEEFSFPNSKSSAKAKVRPKMRVLLRKYVLAKTKAADCR